jgi:ubiquinone/menaquinone biosynthesis C-methylase UbiE
MANTSKEAPIGAGKSSFDLIDPERFFGELQLKKGSTFMDMACGRGLYAVAASEIVGADGTVYAIDLWEEGITTLREQASARGIKNIEAIVGDVGKRIPVENDSVDVCLMATVLHDLVHIEAADAALREIARLLRPQGSLAIMEFKKIDGPPGPPIHIRMTSEEVESMVIPYGFKKKQTVEVGPHNYLITFAAHGIT